MKDAATPGRFALPESDARAMVRLLAEVAVTPGGIMAQKRRLVEGIAELTDTDSWMWNVTRQVLNEPPVAVSMLHNLSEYQLSVIAEGYAQGSFRVFDEKMIELTQRHPHWTRHLAQLVPREQFESTGAPAVWHRTNAMCGESLFTLYRVPGRDDLISGVGLHRAEHRPRYTAREARILHILTSEVRWLHEMSVPSEDGSTIASLPPRLQSVLHMLIDGQSAKRIAYHLEISEHTVRGYIKDIYRRFNVGSRPELMRRFMIGDGGDAP